MFPRKLRLSRRGFESARGLNRAASRYFSVSHGPAPEEGGAAVVVSKKVARLSVMRHLLRRRVMAVARPYASPERALIIHVRPGAGQVAFPLLRDELIGLLRSILPAQP
ncbi:MAG TPA: ribonuclease P protein component [Candidatus Paceibacterota bacterium]